MHLAVDSFAPSIAIADQPIGYTYQLADQGSVVEPDRSGSMFLDSAIAIEESVVAAIATYPGFNFTVACS